MVFSGRQIRRIGQKWSIKRPVFEDYKLEVKNREEIINRGRLRQQQK